MFDRNFRTVVLLGNNKNISPLKTFFTDNPDYGYKLMKVFTLEDHKREKVDKCLSFVLENMCSSKRVLSQCSRMGMVKLAAAWTTKSLDT